MNLDHAQIIIMQIYRRAANLTIADYRDILRRHSGCVSSRDNAWTQTAFEETMAAVETVLWSRVDSGSVPDPRGHIRQIRDEFYWRKRRSQPGMINSRQYHLIQRLWSDLVQLLPPDQRSTRYCAAIVSRATGKRDIGVTALTSSEAAAVIDALRDRLNYAGQVPEHARATQS